jgi:hypothetical protein
MQIPVVCGGCIRGAYDEGSDCGVIQCSKDTKALEPCILMENCFLNVRIVFGFMSGAITS